MEAVCTALPCNQIICSFPHGVVRTEQADATISNFASPH
jgi:hypothetical protein